MTSIVHKFGGTSVGSVEAFRSVLRILEAEHKRAGPGEMIAVVVSAMSGVTDSLIRAAHLAAQQDPEYKSILDTLWERHKSTSENLLEGSSLREFNQITENEFNDLHEILRGVWHGRHLPDTTLELVSGHGELWSSRLLAAAWSGLQPSAKPQWLDARTVLVAKNGETGPQIEWQTSAKKLGAAIGSTKRLVITGFIASTPEGVPTTLKRNGSDFSAAIFGRLLKVEKIVIWTDVDGVYSADPRKVPEARCLNELSYQEAIELAYFGAKVIHPHTMGPAIALQIPIWIKNTFHPEVPGTVIHQPNPESRSDLIARGFTTIDRVALLNLEGTGMIGVPGVAERLFGALRDAAVNVILISQASSEHSICVAVTEDNAELGRSVLEKEFESELHHGQIQSVHVTSPCSIVAMVGDRMVEKQGVSARFFTALSHAGVSVRAIAQGSSERNLSAVIDQKDSTRALRATHSAFFLSDFTMSVGVIGTGQIGKALLRQLQERRAVLQDVFKTDLRVGGTANSKTDLRDFITRVKAEHIPHTVLVDCSASDEVAERYADWLAAGIHVVTPNKKAGAGSWARYAKIRDVSAASGRQFLYEATVGAGLPVISTLRDLIQTGDEVISIEGLLSGTLAYVLSQFHPANSSGGYAHWPNGNTGSAAHAASFSHIVGEAKKLGYTEPDPRDDLNGLDVARKIVILAREAGVKLELTDVNVTSLVPAALQDLKSADQFLSQLPKFDKDFLQKRELAEKSGGVLRFVGSFDFKSRKAGASLRVVPSDHPFARVKGSDNIIAFRTRRYDAQPLIVQGPGAGPEVTAAGVFSDLLRLARSLGARA